MTGPGQRPSQGGPAYGWQAKLARALREGRGVRLGEAAVVSRGLHVVELREPGRVVIMRGVDFGQAAYGLADPGQVVHIDVFHAVADVDHRAVAAAVRRALEALPAPPGAGPGRLLADYFDLGTATGGGRVTSGMDRMVNRSAKAAHRNHVHLAGLLPDEDLALVWRIVAAVEAAILAQGVELRRVDRLAHRWGGVRSGEDSDLSRYYGDNLDSYINRNRSGRTGQPAGSLGARLGIGGLGNGGLGRGGLGDDGGAGNLGPGSLRSGCPEVGGLRGGGVGSGALGADELGAGGLDAGSLWSGQAGAAAEPAGGRGPGGGGGPGGGRGSGGGIGPGGGGGPGSGGPGGSPGSGWAEDPREQAARALQEAREAERMLQALTLARKLGSPDDLARILEDLNREQGWSALYQGGGNQAPFILRQLEEAGLVRKEIRGMRLTPEGKELLAFLRRRLRDVKLRFRKLIRRVPGRSAGLRRRRPGQGAPSPEVRYGVVRGAAPAEPGAWLNDVAVPETVTAAIRRAHLERVRQREAGLPADGPVRVRLERRDIHLHLRSAEQALHLCLLIDASASMAGRRIMAAKHLARHLLVSTRDRIAVIAFQERDVRVYVPFTRNYGVVEDGLARIQPMGLTPLAHGLTQSMELIASARVRRPLLLLITDGIPTVPKWTVDPLADAIEAARRLRAQRIPFSCIGLQPSRRYLEQLTKQAGGTLHVVDELSEESLIRIAHHERQRLAPHAH